MNTGAIPRRRHTLVALLALLVGGLIATPLGAAPAAQSAPVCSDGYVLWANHRSRQEALNISGSGGVITGSVRSNAGIKLSGSENSLSGPVAYATRFQNSGSRNSYPRPVKLAPAPQPAHYAIASYRPGGNAAEAARAAGQYHYVYGDFNADATEELRGLYYVTGNAKLSASALHGRVTIVAEGEIDLSGSYQQLHPYADGLLLFSNKAAPGSAIIKLAGGASVLRGAIYGPGGMVELSGSDTALSGLVLGDTLALSGSDQRLAFAGEHCPGLAAPLPPMAPYAPGELVVKLDDDADLEAVALAHGLEPTPLDRFGARPIYRLRIVDGVPPLEKAAQLLAAADEYAIEFAEPNYLVHDPESSRARGSWVIGGEDAQSYAGQWAPGTIGLDAAHHVSRGAQVTVAVLDTGVDHGHPALQGRLVPGFDFVDFDSNPAEVGAAGLTAAYGHGTHVAGLVALVAPEAQIMPVRVLDANGHGNIWVLVEGLLYAVERGPDGLAGSGDEATVVNLSLGTLRRTQLLQELVAAIGCDGCAGAGDVVVVLAAGNSGDTTPHYPAAEQVAGSLTVGASTSGDLRAGFSSFGPWVQLAAPGAGIVSSVPGGSYAVWSGSSMAAPFAAGVAALVRSARPELSAAETVAHLIARAKPIAGEIPARLDAGVALTTLGAP